jgi:hypothetical protein
MKHLHSVEPAGPWSDATVALGAVSSQHLEFVITDDHRPVVASWAWEVGRVKQAPLCAVGA